MSKHKLYKDIRDQLKTDYEKELTNVLSLLDSGIHRIEGAATAVECSDSISLVSEGEAGKVFRAEIADTLSLVLQRYADNLADEMDHLGLKSIPDSKPNRGTVVHGLMNGNSNLKSA